MLINIAALDLANINLARVERVRAAASLVLYDDSLALPPTTTVQLSNLYLQDSAAGAEVVAAAVTYYVALAPFPLEGQTARAWSGNFNWSNTAGEVLLPSITCGSTCRSGRLSPPQGSTGRTPSSGSIKGQNSIKGVSAEVVISHP